MGVFICKERNEHTKRMKIPNIKKERKKPNFNIFKEYTSIYPFNIMNIKVGEHNFYHHEKVLEIDKKERTINLFPLSTRLATQNLNPKILTQREFIASYITYPIYTTLYRGRRITCPIPPYIVSRLRSTVDRKPRPAILNPTRPERTSNTNIYHIEVIL